MLLARTCGGSHAPTVKLRSRHWTGTSPLISALTVVHRSIHHWQDLLRKAKFAFAIENSAAYDYVTEKLYQPFGAGAGNVAHHQLATACLFVVTHARRSGSFFRGDKGGTWATLLASFFCRAGKRNA